MARVSSPTEVFRQPLWSGGVHVTGDLVMGEIRINPDSGVVEERDWLGWWPVTK